MICEEQTTETEKWEFLSSASKIKLNNGALKLMQINSGKYK